MCVTALHALAFSCFFRHVPAGIALLNCTDHFRFAFFVSVVHEDWQSALLFWYSETTNFNLFMLWIMLGRIFFFLLPDFLLDSSRAGSPLSSWSFIKSIVWSSQRLRTSGGSLQWCVYPIYWYSALGRCSFCAQSPLNAPHEIRLSWQLTRQKEKLRCSSLADDSNCAAHASELWALHCVYTFSNWETMAMCRMQPN